MAHFIFRSLLPVTAIVATLFSATSAPCHGQITLSSDISPRVGTTSDSFRYVVTVEGAQAAPPPLLTGGDDFALSLIGPQTSLSIINGNVESKTSYHYRLLPKKAGELLSPTAEIETPNGKLTAPSIPVTVTEASENNTDSQTTASTAGKELFLQQTLMPEGEVFVGQQLVNSVTLFTRVPAENINFENLTTDGFLQETLSDDERSTVLLHGAEYASIQVLHSLFPLRTGHVQIPARRLTARIIHQDSNRDPFGAIDPFDHSIFGNLLGFHQLQDVSIQSNSLSVTVLPLPPPPAELAKLISAVPLVGETSLKVDYPLDVIKVGQSKTVTVTVTSEGNVNPLKTLPFSTPDQIKLYEENAETVRDTRGHRIKSIKKFRYTLVPLKGGFYTIPPVSLGYFDPQTKTYKVASSAVVSLVVQGGTILGESTIPPDPDSGTAVPDLLHSKESPLSPTSPLAYEEPSLLESLRANLSVELLTLLGVSIVGIAVIVLVARTVAVRERLPLISNDEIGSAQTAVDLQTLYRNFLMRALSHERNSKLPAENCSTDQLRAMISASQADPEVKVAARALLDDLERELYSFQLDDTSDKLSPLKEQFRRLVCAW